jgi:long-chain fatty acid transport protein
MNGNRVHRSLGAALAGTTLVLLLAAPEARAGGFLVYDVSGAPVAKGSAVVASITDPDAVWYNPAGLSFGPAYGFSLGGVYTTAKSTFSPKGGGPTAGTVPGNFLLPHVFASVKATDWMQLGLGLFSTWGLGSEWKKDWVGNTSAIQSSMTVITVNPTLSFRLHRDVALGVGVQVIRANLDALQALPDPIGGTARFGGTSWGYGANVGVMWRVLPDRLSVGVTYRSRVKLAFKGRIDLDPNPDFRRDLPDGPITTDMTLPDILAVGVTLRPIPSLEVGLDGNLILWHVYDRTTVKRTDGQVLADVPHGCDDSIALRAGLDWATPAKGLNLRLGLIWDRTPTRQDLLDAGMPDSDQIDVTAGLGYAWKWLKADLGYQYIQFLPNQSKTGQVGPEGTYRTRGHFLALTLAFLFGQR